MPKIYIAAPFGNYISTKNTTSVIGTFTHKPRSGLILQILKTLRYDFQEKAWYNALGLRNPGILEGVRRYNNKSNQVLSIAAINPQDYDYLNAIIPTSTKLEINISCPNITHFEDYLKGLPQFQPRNPIIKLSPQIDNEVIDRLLHEGFTHFHASNTLKTYRGGRSGSILKPYTLKTIEYIRKRIGDKGRIIAGGGITNMNDIEEYIQGGANDVSLGTVCFNLVKMRALVAENGGL